MAPHETTREVLKDHPNLPALLDWLDRCLAGRRSRWLAARFELDLLLVSRGSSLDLEAFRAFADVLVGDTLTATPRQQFETFTLRRTTSPASKTVIPGGDVEYANVQSFVKFVTNQCHGSDVYFDDALVANPQADALWKTIDGRTVDGGGFDGVLTGHRSIFWLTHATRLFPSARTVPKCEDLCSELGLWWIADNEPCVLVRVPASSVPDLRRPTIFDAVGFDAFCPARGTEGWGRALTPVSILDGGVESVHKEVPWDADFRVTGVGLAAREEFVFAEADERALKAAIARRSTVGGSAP